MTIASVIYSRLSNTAGLVALIATRAYRVIAPQGVTIPFVTYRVVSAIRQSGMGTDIGIVEARLQFDIVANTYESAVAITEQLRTAMQRWIDPSSAPAVLDSYIENVFDGFDDDTDLFHNVLETRLFYRES